MQWQMGQVRRVNVAASHAKVKEIGQLLEHGMQRDQRRG